MRRSSTLRLIAVLAATTSCAGEPPEQATPPSRVTPTVARHRPVLAQLARDAGGFVSSVDAEGVPQFIWAIDQPISLWVGTIVETFTRSASVPGGAIPGNLGALEASNVAVVKALGLAGGGTLALFRRFRLTLVAEPYLLAEGFLQFQDHVISIRMQSAHGITVIASGVPSHDFG